MRQVFAIAMFAAFLVVGTLGCDTPDASNVMEGADASAVANYEALVAADEAAMTEEDASEVAEDPAEATPAAE